MKMIIIIIARSRGCGWICVRAWSAPQAQRLMTDMLHWGWRISSMRIPWPWRCGRARAFIYHSLETALCVCASDTLNDRLHSAYLARNCIYSLMGLRIMRIRTQGFAYHPPENALHIFLLGQFQICTKFNIFVLIFHKQAWWRAINFQLLRIYKFYFIWNLL